MSWWHFVVAGAWLALFFITRRRSFREARRNAAVAGDLRDMGGRGGF